MLEAKFGNSWEELIRVQHFEPLELLMAGFGARDTKERPTSR
jgi:hypothetical protein